MKQRILVIEDDPGMANLTKTVLVGQGFRVRSATTAEEALDMIRRDLPDLVIMDIQLPGLSGLKLCEILKSEPRTASLPIMFLTVEKGDLAKVHGLDIGADDYLTKPFSSRELVARVRALLRRVQYAGAPVKQFKMKGLTVDLDRHEITLRGKPIPLRRKEYELLVLFLQKRGRILTKEFLTERIWKDEAIVTSNTLNVHIKNLRRKLGPYKDWIETVVGEGYKLKDLE